MAKQRVADAGEVLEALTSILRREEDENVKPSEVLRAAELLGKRYGLFAERDDQPSQPPQIVVDVPRPKP